MPEKKSARDESSLNGAKEGAQQKRITLLDVSKRRLVVKIKSLSSLIVHAWSAKAIKQMEDAQQKKAKKGREPKDPEAEFNACFYRDKEGRYCFPATGLKKAMISAATSIDDKINFPKTKIRQALFIEGDLIPIVYETEPDMRTDPVRVGTGTDMRYRPEFKEWGMTITITYNESVVSAEQVINLLNLAGFGVGIGDWRPEKDGDHGRFEVVKG